MRARAAAVLLCLAVAIAWTGAQKNQASLRVLGVLRATPLASEDAPLIGERPAVESHLNQSRIASGSVSLQELIEHGRILFEARFNVLDGQGRPSTTGGGIPRTPNQPAFIRTSGPDATSCMGCHFQPRTGGAGDFAANVFVLAQERDPVVETVNDGDSNERNSPGLMGAGAIEMLAREMSAELIAIRDGARADAKHRQQPVRRELKAKGVSFGAITVLPDGRVNPGEIEGVDWDLIIKPFHQKGAVVSIREFTNTALNHHHGIQSVERFGAGIDPDADGKSDELTVGDITALTVFQAALGVPGRLLPGDPARREAAERGERLFEKVGCASCHVPALTLNSSQFSEPNPFNPVGNLRAAEPDSSFTFDLARQGPQPRPQLSPDGKTIVRAYTDLKRHDLNDEQYHHFSNERVPQGTLSGTARGSSFTEPPLPRPTRQFLTRKLWDVGNTEPYGHRGDLTTLTEAIYFHGGEARAARDSYFALTPADRAAVVEFLKTLQILPEGSTAILAEPTASKRSVEVSPR